MIAKIEDGVEIPSSNSGGKAKKPLSQERAREPVHEMRAYESWDASDKDMVDDKPWVRPTSLDAPPARPGFMQRWVRVAVYNDEDPTNTSRKFREGWKPRPADTVPQSYSAPTISHGKWAGAVGVEGSILCEMPKKMWQKRRDAVEKRTRDITDAIEQELQAQSRPGMEITQTRSSRVVREVKIQADE